MMQFGHNTVLILQQQSMTQVFLFPLLLQDQDDVFHSNQFIKGKIWIHVNFTSNFFLDIWFFEKTREIECQKFNLYLPQQLFY